MIERRRGYLRAENLPATVRRFRRESEPMTFNVGTSLAELQREATIRTLRATGGNHRRAAKIWASLLTLCTRRLPNMELNLIVLARSPILCRKIFPSQRQLRRTKGR